jgi:hypothetical protein
MASLVLPMGSYELPKSLPMHFSALSARELTQVILNNRHNRYSSSDKFKMGQLAQSLQPKLM